MGKNERKKERETIGHGIRNNERKKERKTIGHGIRNHVPPRASITKKQPKKTTDRENHRSQKERMYAEREREGERDSKREI